MVLLIYVILIAVYIYAPVYIELIMLLANMFIPDAVPYIDEIIMMGTVIAKLKNGG